jgi:hypothetical protein
MFGQEPYRTPWNFLGLPEDRSDPMPSRGWLLPVPCESTTSCGAGTRDRPAAILAAFRQVEFCDSEFDGKPAVDYGIPTTPPLNPVHRSPEAMVKPAEDAVAELFSGAPAPEVLGVVGCEHTISAGVARGLARARTAGSLVAVHVDAHLDMGEEHEGSPAVTGARDGGFWKYARFFGSAFAVFRAARPPFCAAVAAPDPRGRLLRDSAQCVGNKGNSSRSIRTACIHPSCRRLERRSLAEYPGSGCSRWLEPSERTRHARLYLSWSNWRLSMVSAHRIFWRPSPFASFPPVRWSAARIGAIHKRRRRHG